jgi:single-strand DNA-binding protein
MINNIVLAGNVVADPTTRNTTTGKSVSTVRLAVNNPLNDKEVLFINVEVWDKQSEFVNKYVKKGNSISAVGRLKQDDWEKDGVKRTSYVVVADRINFFGAKKTNGDTPVKTSVVVDTEPADEIPGLSEKV